ncbi:thioesterase II family protein [Clostridium beijerinckii]|nr:thioesterase domain-containing protein [Clostridium beijerinckii]MBF7807456.1 thioesterase [Clostridium beijerinckii]NOW88087.1 surfactin synthase thioesterase subunit [Clostridium beijerinckii]NRT25893.1 surfactin synthase thioesterase subunit [Clostridium beijerinckii]NRT66509.1 surfactin synthase thioesterase subunit [Clostridium beijerinckii]NRT81988.1 surfactin synthase thioesterase subunit [Clostridium beijerinckii]
MSKKETIKLLLLPYAGGSGLFYTHWEKYLDEHIILSPVELPGRGSRFKEPLCDNTDKVIDSIFDFVKDEIKDCNYAIFGYCVGTVLVYELYKRIVDNNLREPSHCILCAHPAPNIPKKDKPLKNTSEEELIEEWLRGSRITKEDLKNKAYLKSFFRVWKSDCKMMDNYRFSYPIYKFNCNLTLIGGKEDTFFAPNELIDEWKKFSNHNCNKYVVDGSHDFLKTNESAVIDVINKVL